MQRQIRIDLLSVDDHSIIMDQGPFPDGITIKGPISTALFSEGAAAVPMFIVVTFAIPIATSVAAAFLYDYLKKHKTKRIRIEREEIIFNRGEIERIVRERLEIEE